MKKKLFIILICVILILSVLVLFVLYKFNIISHKMYDNSDFGIDTYISLVDMDNDGVDDQSDILSNVRNYIATKPKYKSNYYGSGYPDDGYGVCTDVVVNGLLGAGYDLRELVSNHIFNNIDLYDVEKPDKNIDFRRVRNLYVYFNSTAIKLTTDIGDIEEWQGGDIVIFQKHIGIVSNKRNRNGIPFLIHHANPYQFRYEEDVLGDRNDIIGHYRIS